MVSHQHLAKKQVKQLQTRLKTFFQTLCCTFRVGLLEKKRLGSCKNFTHPGFIKTFLTEQEVLDLAAINTGLVHCFGGPRYKKGPQKRVFRGILGLYIFVSFFFSDSHSKVRVYKNNQTLSDSEC